jgi:prepilin-type N-terminal cleavage/methylation domain-containing protein
VAEHWGMARSRQSGFTLIEMMVAVAILGVLAWIAMPSFMNTSRRVKGDSEVSQFIAELRVREEQYVLERGAYLSTGANENDMFPTTPLAAGQNIGAVPATWQQLRVRPPTMNKIRCAYTVVAGTATDTPGAIATNTFNYVKPDKNWFYILARCNLDGSSVLDSYYFTTSESSQILKKNPGK